MDKIKILKVEPGKPPCVKEIANDFKASQAEVEGDIECVGFGDGCVAVINAEGKLNGMQPNRRNGDDIICGPFFICGDSPDGDFISLTEQQIEEYTRRFGEIEQFTGQEPELEPHMTQCHLDKDCLIVRNSYTADKHFVYLLYFYLITLLT